MYVVVDDERTRLFVDQCRSFAVVARNFEVAPIEKRMSTTVHQRRRRETEEICLDIVEKHKSAIRENLMILCRKAIALFVDLGRHELRRSDDAQRANGLDASRRREAEIADFHVALMQEDVVALDVAMNHRRLLRVQIDETVEHLARPILDHAQSWCRLSLTQKPTIDEQKTHTKY